MADQVKKSAAKKSGNGRARGKSAATVAEGRALLTGYLNKLAPDESGKPGGWESEEEFLWTYVVPMAVNRLAALDRYAKKAGK